MTTRSENLRALAVLIVAFVAGGAAGVAADRAWLRPSPGMVVPFGARHDRRPSRAEEAEAIPAPLEQLELTPDEEQRLHAIARRWRPQAQQAVAALRPVVAQLENDMFAEMLCALPTEKRDKYLVALRAQTARQGDTTLIEKRFRLVNSKQCAADSAAAAVRR